MENEALILSEEEQHQLYEESEMVLLRKALLRTPEERFTVMAQLMKRSLMLKSAKVKHFTINPKY